MSHNAVSFVSGSSLAWMNGSRPTEGQKRGAQVILSNHLSFPAAMVHFPRHPFLWYGHPSRITVSIGQPFGVFWGPVLHVVEDHGFTLACYQEDNGEASDRLKTPQHIPEDHNFHLVPQLQVHVPPVRISGSLQVWVPSTKFRGPACPAFLIPKGWLHSFHPNISILHDSINQGALV